jgi:hypothetical protein
VLHDKKLKDILPQPVPALPPPCIDLPLPHQPEPLAPLHSEHPENNDVDNSPPEGSSGSGSQIRRVLNTTRNSFGLFRRYFAKSFPSHDPESEITISALSNIVDPQPSDPPVLGPYPNKSSFRLGDWYWNHGAQKSQQDFKNLVAIVGAEDFEPAEVRSTRWDKINRQLALNDWDKEEWLDDDAGWRTSEIKISVPFDRLTECPGVREYVVGSLHHRSLVSVIRDKISNPCASAHLHYEPYELLWQPTADKEEIRVQGELYTSPVFIDAHNALQNSPMEPNCNLPRVVVALMFWSDATHLTNFGSAKLWPLYMFFGNESKYRRCTPSCNSCEHVAYFETVCLQHMSTILINVSF